MNLDCQQVRELMDSYLSEELSVETNHGFLRHVAECRDCAAELKRRQRLRALLSETLDLAVNDVNADRVRMRITHALDGERARGNASPVSEPLPRRSSPPLPSRYWAGRRVDAAAYNDSAEDHVACALTYPSGTVTTRIARRITSRHRSSTLSTPSVDHTACTT